MPPPAQPSRPGPDANPDPAAAKAALRAEMRRRAPALTPEERREASQNLCARLRADPGWIRAGRVGLFMPLPTEPDVLDLLVQARSEGRDVALPRWDATRNAYEFAVVGNEPTLPGHFGIAEPGPACPSVPANQLDLILVPGLAFSPDGRRLGRGRGFFDRLLAGVARGRCGVAFDWQLVEDVPTEAHDIRVDCVVTPGGRWPTATCG